MKWAGIRAKEVVYLLRCIAKSPDKLNRLKTDEMCRRYRFGNYKFSIFVDGGDYDYIEWVENIKTGSIRSFDDIYYFLPSVCFSPEDSLTWGEYQAYMSALGFTPAESDDR